MFGTKSHGLTPPKVFEFVKNVAAATIYQGYVVAWEYTATVANDGCKGYTVTKPAGVLRVAVAGVVTDTSIADDGVGVIQIWGHCTKVRYSGGSGLVTSKITLGEGVGVLTAGYMFKALKSVASNAKIYPHQMKVWCHAGVPATSGNGTVATSWYGTGFLRCF